VSVPRYFFDVHDGELICDEDGVECSSLKEVRQQTRHLLPKLIGEMVPPEKDDLIYRVFVRDEHGHLVYTSALTYSGLWVNSGPPS
jgi:hypothetical protein